MPWAVIFPVLAMSLSKSRFTFLWTLTGIGFPNKKENQGFFLHPKRAESDHIQRLQLTRRGIALRQGDGKVQHHSAISILNTDKQSGSFMDDIFGEKYRLA